MKEIGNADRREAGRRLNNRAENSHQPFRRRERARQRFRSMKTLQKLSSVHAQVHNHFKSGAPSRHPPGLQTKALRRVGRVARPRGLIAAWVCACCAQPRRPAVALTKPLRNVEDLLAERGIDISHETVRFWWNRFGPMFAAEIRKRRVAHMRGYPQWRWHLDEAFVKVNGKLCYLWRAVDHEGEVLEAVVTAKRDKAAALKFLKRIMKKYGRPLSVVTDGLCSYPAAMKEIGNADRQEAGRRLNNRAENSHQPFRRRERAMQRFRSMKTLQKFSSVHAQVHNHFNQERHLVTRQVYKQRRSAALAEWSALAA